MKSTLSRGIILPDLHAPYHDKRAWRLFLNVVKDFQCDWVLSLGDFYDGYAVSRYVKDPQKDQSFYREIQLGRKLCLEPLNALGIKRKIITLGNHDERPDAYLREKAPAVYEQYLHDDWLGFRSTGWEVYPYHEFATLGKLIATHDVGVMGAHRVLNAVQNNVVSGHDHRMDYVVEGTSLGVTHVSATFGWMGDRKHAEYMHKIQAMRKWVLGFGLGYIAPNGYSYLVPVPIVNYTCVVEGRWYSAV